MPFTLGERHFLFRIIMESKHLELSKSLLINDSANTLTLATPAILQIKTVETNFGFAVDLCFALKTTSIKFETFAD